MIENNDTIEAMGTEGAGRPAPRRRVAGLRAAALAGVIVSVGAFGSAAAAADEPAASESGSVVIAEWGWPGGSSTCCPENQR